MGGSERHMRAGRRGLLRMLLCVGLALCATPPLMAQEQAKKPTRKEVMAQRRERMKEVRRLLVERKNKVVAARKEQLQEKRDELLTEAEAARMKADSIMSLRNQRITTDTLWVARPQQTWTFRAKTDMLGDLLHIRARDLDGNQTNYFLANDPKMTLGVMANYRGVSLSLSFSPNKLLSDLSDMASTINYYSNTVGFDVNFEKIDAFRGRTSLQSRRRKLENTNLRSFSASGYYVFNGKKFSYPAVFNSTWVQNRSAGSFLVQANFSTGRLKIGDPIDEGYQYKAQLNRIDINSFSIGAGYGYNLVAGRHWLIHATAQPSMMVWKNYRLHTMTQTGTEQREKMPSNHLNVFIVGRLGAIYSWNRYFIGLTSVVQTSKTGRDSDISLTDTKWKGRAFFGWRM